MLSHFVSTGMDLNTLRRLLGAMDTCSAGSVPSVAKNGSQMAETSPQLYLALLFLDDGQYLACFTSALVPDKKIFLLAVLGHTQ